MAEVLRRNPSLEAAQAAWNAAAERYPQVVALEDPLFQSMLAPGSFRSSSSVQASYFVGIAQKVPWAGKRALRGQIAQAEANAASLDSQDVRLRLTEATRDWGSTARWRMSANDARTRRRLAKQVQYTT